MSTTPLTVTPEKTADERKAILARLVGDQVTHGWRVESQTDYQAILAKGHNHSHGLHLFLTIITLGLWGIFVWLPLSIFGGLKQQVISVDEQGRASFRH